MQRSRFVVVALIASIALAVGGSQAGKPVDAIQKTQPNLFLSPLAPEQSGDLAPESDDLRDAGVAIERAVAFLIGQQEPDGGWNSGPDTVSSTALVVVALTQHQKLDVKPLSFMAIPAGIPQTKLSQLQAFAAYCRVQKQRFVSNVEGQVVDWRSDIIQFLIETQEDDGAWSSGADNRHGKIIDTACALLALKDAVADLRSEGNWH